MNKVRTQSGFSLFELVVVITIVGVLMATGLKYYLDLMDETRRASLNLQAANFSAAVANVHVKWVLESGPDAVSIGSDRVLLNSLGWPVAATFADGKAPENVCHQLWYALMKSREEVPLSSSSRGMFISGPEEGYCSFDMSRNSKERLHFRYFPADGKVSIGNVF